MLCGQFMHGVYLGFRSVLLYGSLDFWFVGLVVQYRQLDFKTHVVDSQYLGCSSDGHDMHCNTDCI